jgi:hypothetical protein
MTLVVRLELVRHHLALGRSSLHRREHHAVVGARHGVTAVRVERCELLNEVGSATELNTYQSQSALRDKDQGIGDSGQSSLETTDTHRHWTTVLLRCLLTGG